MLKIALVQKKGGVGKTTISILLHEAIRQTGQAVTVRDYDAQGSASKVMERLKGSDGPKETKADVLLIDTPPSLIMPSTGAAVKEADIVLIPCSPSPVDIWESEEVVRYVQSKNPQALVRLVLNRTRIGTLLTEAAAGNLAGIAAPLLTVTLGDRQSYQHALIGGWAALDAKAQKELLQFTVAITSLR